MATGVVLAVDVGKARVGIAACDAERILAFPVETVPRHPEHGALQRIAELSLEHHASTLVVGLPLNLHNARTLSTDDAIAFASKLNALASTPPIVLLDERLSTVEAHRSLQHSKHTGRRQRAVVDQAAAVVILEQYLSPNGERMAQPLSAVASVESNSPSGEESNHGHS